MITNLDEFNSIIDAQIEDCREVLKDKFNEYQSGKDMLSNFNNIALMLKCSTSEAWLGMWLKHVESIIAMIKGKACYDDYKWSEKITDAINYLLLLQCILHQDKVEPQYQSAFTKEEIIEAFKKKEE